MSNSCSALATKQEVQSLEAEINQLQAELNGKIDKEKEKPIINTASSIGASIAIAAFDPQVRAILAKIANFAGRLASLISKVAGIASLILSLASIASVAYLQFRVAKLEKQVNGAVSLANDAIAASNNARLIANQAITTANDAVRRANNATARAEQSIITSNIAVVRANLAFDRAGKAIENANEAIKATEAVQQDARTAIAKSNAAAEVANQATLKANEAIQRANFASLKADKAIKIANSKTQGNDDSALELAQLRALYNQLLKSQKVLGEKIIATAESAGAAVAVATIAAEVADKKTDSTEVNGSGLIVRTVRNLKVTNYGDITTLKSAAVQMTNTIEQDRKNAVNKVSKIVADVQVIVNRKNELEEKIEKARIASRGGAGISQKDVEKLVDTKIDTQTKDIEKMNEKQYQDLLKGIAGVTTLVGGLSIPNYDGKFRSLLSNTATIKTQTSPNALTQAATAGVCNSTRPGGCMQRNVVDKLSGNIGNLISAGGTAFSAANNALLLRMNGTLGAVANTVKTINSTTNATLATVTNAKHGLQAIQNFAATAWKATGADKILNTVSAIASLHNAAMLSQNAAQSMGDVASNALSLFGIKDGEGNPIDVNQIIGGAIRNKLVSVFGEANLAAASTAWLKLNRIHQAVSMTVYSIQGTKNALLEADEITGGHIAKVGNALQEQGIIEEDTYDWMNPEPDYQQPFKGILGKIDAIEEMSDRVSSVVSTGLEIKENTTEIVTNSQTLIDATTDFITTRNEEETTRTEESASPSIDRLDVIKSETEEAT